MDPEWENTHKHTQKTNGDDLCPQRRAKTVPLLISPSPPSPLYLLFLSLGRLLPTNTCTSLFGTKTHTQTHNLLHILYPFDLTAYEMNIATLFCSGVVLGFHTCVPHKHTHTVTDMHHSHRDRCAFRHIKIQTLPRTAIRGQQRPSALPGCSACKENVWDDRG